MAFLERNRFVPALTLLFLVCNQNYSHFEKMDLLDREFIQILDHPRTYL